MTDKVKLTSTSALGLTAVAGQAQTIYWDTDLTGFGVRVSPRGKAVFFVQYRDKVGRQAKHTLGPVDGTKVGGVKVDGVTADAARSKAKAALAQVHLGGNPQEALTGRRASARVIDLIETYLDQAKVGKKARSFEEVERALRKKARPLHQAKADEVTRADIAGLLTKVAKDSGPYAANRARAYLSALWSWSLKQGLIEAGNPVALTNAVIKEKARERVLSDAELALIWRCTGSGHDHDRIVRLLMLTAARRDEVGSMAWAELGDRSQDGGAPWTLPSDRTKNGLPNEIWLGSLALDQLPTQRGNYVMVFGREAEDPRGFSGWSKCKTRLDARMLSALKKGFAKVNGREPKDGEVRLAPWRLHDLRRTFSTGANESGIEPHVVEAVLNHVSGAARKGVAGTYNRARYRVQKRAALTAWERHVRLVCGLPSLGDNVTELRAAS